jgi:hypothetical protein
VSPDQNVLDLRAGLLNVWSQRGQSVAFELEFEPAEDLTGSTFTASVGGVDCPVTVDGQVLTVLVPEAITTGHVGRRLLVRENGAVIITGTHHPTLHGSPRMEVLAS